MSRKRGAPKTAKATKKGLINRKWKRVGLKDNEVFNLEEGGLISFEELTDYSISELRNIEKHDEDEPPAKKKRPRPEKQELTEADVASQKKSKDLSNDDNLDKQESFDISKEKLKTKSGKKRLQRRKKSKDKTSNKPDDELKITNVKTGTDKGNELANDENWNSTEDSLTKDIPTEIQSQQEKMPSVKCDMSEWNGLGLPEEILAALAEKEFTQPTPIQAATLPVAIFHHQDIIGAAETGSGKTLAFSLPILAHILDMKRRADSEKTESNLKPLYSLILTPTRELAVQIKKHIVEVTKYTSVRCAVIVGGLSEQKQERILGKCPEIVIGTPGRLLNLISNENPHLKKLNSVKFLVLDEVDRMLEFGHFKEVSEILRLMSLSSAKRQNFLFSATLTLPQYHKKLAGKAHKKNAQESVQMLVDKANVNSKAKIIDLSRQHITAEQIVQKRIICTEEEKDLYMLYVLMCFPGRTLVFVNSINCTRKICNLLTVLGRNPLQLHAGKQQRQRLKSLDKFTSVKDAVMIATDVAARGLDIPDVDVVIHYHLPKDPKIYIHRSGRTARAKKGGVSIILEGPEDFREYKKICDVMKLEKDLPSLDVDSSLLPGLKKRVSLALRIEKEEHQQRKVDSEKNWFQRAAKSLDVDFDYQHVDDEAETKKKASSNAKLLRKELNQMLKLPLVPKGFSGTYITRTGSLQKMMYRP